MDAIQGSGARCAAHDLALGPRGACVLCRRAATRPTAPKRAVGADVPGELETPLSWIATSALASGLVASAGLTVAALTFPTVRMALDPGWGAPTVIMLPPRRAVTDSSVEAEAEARVTAVEATVTVQRVDASSEAQASAMAERERLMAEAREAALREEEERDRARKAMIARIVEERSRERAIRRARAAPAVVTNERPGPAEMGPPALVHLGTEGSPPESSVRWRFATGLQPEPPVAVTRRPLSASGGSGLRWVPSRR